MTNTANRILLVCLLLASMVLCTILFIVPGRIFAWLATSFGSLAHFFGRHEALSVGRVVQLAIGIILAALVDLLLVLAVVLEVRRPRARAIRVEKAGGKAVTIEASSVGDRLRHEVGQLPGVLRVRPTVKARRGGVVVGLQVDTSAGGDVPDQASDILEVTRRVIEEQLGLKLARSPKVHLRALHHPGVRTAAVRAGEPIRVADVAQPQVEDGSDLSLPKVDA